MKLAAQFKFWLLQNGLGLDQQLNALLGGHAEETLSARAWRAWANGRIFGRIFRPFIDALCFWQTPDVFRADGEPVDSHCERAYLKECERKYLPAEYREEAQ